MYNHVSGKSTDDTCQLKPSLVGFFTEDVFSESLSKAGVGFFMYNCSKNLLELCPVAAQMSNLSLILSLKTLMGRLESGRRKVFLLNIMELAREGSWFSYELPIVLNGQEAKWFKLSGYLRKSPQGAESICGTVSDVSLFRSEMLRKKDLMAFMNHELKTPLSALKLYVQSCVRFLDKSNMDVLKSQMAKADAQISAMANLIDGYLTLSLLENGSLDLQFDSFDCTELIHHIVSQYLALNPEYIFDIQMNEGIFLEGDRARIEQVINNFVGNAIKFSDKGSTITMVLKLIDVNLEFSVTDSGRGIALKDQSKIFTRYFRSCASGEHTVNGHGLGLYLSEEIIKAHQGAVFFVSQHGVGSCFGFRVPQMRC